MSEHSYEGGRGGGGHTNNVHVRKRQITAPHGRTYIRRVPLLPTVCVPSMPSSARRDSKHRPKFRTWPNC